MELSPLRWTDIARVAADAKPSACSLDSWRPEELSALGRWFPSLFRDLTDILNWVEKTGVWPRELLKAYVALIPKDPTLTEPAATDWRPISVLSGIYRIWSAARFKDCLPWQEKWAPATMYGCRPGR
eukprot:5591965-Pyramimonas_sp.AAC.1